jgi:hypothetical protein
MHRGRRDSSGVLSHYLPEGFAVLATTLVSLSEAAAIRGLVGLWTEVLAEVACDGVRGPTVLRDEGHAVHMAGMVGSTRTSERAGDAA